jgi:hypothetical protein
MNNAYWFGVGFITGAIFVAIVFRVIYYGWEIAHRKVFERCKEAIEVGDDIKYAAVKYSALKMIDEVLRRKS